MHNKTFEINNDYLTSVSIHKTYSNLSNPDNPTKEDLVKILKGTHFWSSSHTEDHPEFAKLRNQLEELGYIQTQRNCWNGDTVLKPFVLNGAKFKKGEQFLSGGAIKYSIDSKLKKT